MNNQLRRLEQILNELQIKSAALDQQLKVASSKYRKPVQIIESDFFSGHGNNFSYYLKQAYQTLHYLSYAVEKSDNKRIASLLETIENQILAISNAINAEETRRKVKSYTPKKALNALKRAAKNKSQSYELYEKLSEYRGYEERLQVMLNEHLASISGKNHLLDEKAQALHKRLSNCRKAILSVEIDIQRLESRK